jgi:ubiquinone/menaquinone biosynthesis C-methylase UbiE
MFGALALGQDLRKIENMYDSVALEYALAFAGEHDKKPQDQAMLQRFARQIKGRGPVWDFGCGPGQTTAYLHGLGVAASGLDLSEKLLAQARASHPGPHFRRGNMLALDFPDNSLAGVVAFYAIVHFSEAQVETALREVFRVLKPGGIFLCTFHVGDQTIHLHEFLGKKIDVEFMFFTTAFISACLKKCGFAKMEMIEREPYSGVEYPSRRAYAFAVKPGGVG